MSEKQIEYAADFWNCQCAERWIHRNEVNDCPRCGVVQSESEHPTVDEVVVILGIDGDQVKRVGD